MRERSGSTAGPDVIASFLDENQLHFTHLSDNERGQVQKQLGAGTAAIGLDLQTTAFYKVRKYHLFVQHDNKVIMIFHFID